MGTVVLATSILGFWGTMRSLKWAFGAAAIMTCGLGADSSFAADIAAMPVKAAMQSADQLWLISYNSEVRYFSWQNTRGYPVSTAPISGSGHGWQTYAPMSLSLTGNPSPNWKYEFVLRGGFVSASQTTSGQRGTVDTMVDSQFSATVTYNGLKGAQPFLAMLVNAPTGSSALYGNSRFARMDGDLVDQGIFGEGWNFGPTAGVNIPLSQSLLLTLSGGYTQRNPYNKEALDPIAGQVTATDKVKNGDEATVTAALGYAQGSLSLQGTASYAWAQVSQVNLPGQFGFNRYGVGPRTTISGSASYAFDAMWSVYANGFWTHTEPNNVLNTFGPNPFGNLILEGFNSNSNLYRVNAGVNYRFASGLTVGPTASYLYRDHNAWNSATFSFSPAKTRWAAGAAANYNVTNKININGKLERIWIRENEFPGPPAFAPFVPYLSGDGWMVAGGATVTF